MENTGMIMKRPSMRSAKIAASDTVARNSGALRRVDVTDGLDIGRGNVETRQAVCAGGANRAVALWLPGTALYETDGRGGNLCFGTRFGTAPRPCVNVMKTPP